MKRRAVQLGFVAALGGAAAGITSGSCGDDGGGSRAILWLALDGAETRVRLVPEQPEPY